MELAHCNINHHRNHHQLTFNVFENLPFSLTIGLATSNCLHYFQRQNPAQLNQITSSQQLTFHWLHFHHILTPPFQHYFIQITFFQCEYLRCANQIQILEQELYIVHIYVLILNTEFRAF